MRYYYFPFFDNSLPNSYGKSFVQGLSTITSASTSAKSFYLSLPFDLINKTLPNDGKIILANLEENILSCTFLNSAKSKSNEP